VIHFSWGLPRKENVAAIRAAKARFAVTVASREGARAAVDVGADYLHCQGLEAGGHLQANRPLDEALRQVVEEAKQVPVIAAGGIGDGLGIRRALLAGAAGAQLGTRFLATRECEYRQEYKDMLLKAKSSDTVATVCFSGNDDDTWGCPHRVLRNTTYRRWEAAGSPDRGSRPGEGETIGKANGNDVKRYDYSLMLLRPGSTAPLDDLVLYAGHSVDQTNDIVSAADLLERLWLECMGKVPVAPSRPKPGMYATRV
jgi:nitronate monooxygenase